MVSNKTHHTFSSADKILSNDTFFGMIKKREQQGWTLMLHVPGSPINHPKLKGACALMPNSYNKDVTGMHSFKM